MVQLCCHHLESPEELCQTEKVLKGMLILLTEWMIMAMTSDKQLVREVNVRTCHWISQFLEQDLLLDQRLTGNHFGWTFAY